MKVSLEVGGKDVHLIVTPSGHYTLGPPGKYERSMVFEEEKLGKLTLRYLNPAVGLGKFVGILKALAFIDKGAHLLAYFQAKDYIDEDFLELLRKTWGEKTYKNFIVEVTLGSFSKEELPIEEDPKDTAKGIFEEGGVYHTRVVGVGYRMKDIEDDEGNLKVNEGDKVYVVWESENEHDENALAVYHSTTSKLGYIRRTISEILVEKVKKLGHLEGKVCFLWRDEYEPMIFLSLDLRR